MSCSCRTIRAALLPLVTARHSKVVAISRKRPAIVEGPEYFYILSPASQIIKELLDVAIVGMDIVQMYNVGGYSFKLADKLFCSRGRIEAVVA